MINEQGLALAVREYIAHGSRFGQVVSGLRATCKHTLPIGRVMEALRTGVELDDVSADEQALLDRIEGLLSLAGDEVWSRLVRSCIDHPLEPAPQIGRPRTVLTDEKVRETRTYGGQRPRGLS